MSKALIEDIENWAKKKGMNELEGPMSFTNLDKAGLLIEGFDQLPTIATLYNYPYYASHLENLGYVKAADWIEHEILNQPLSERFIKFNDILKEKYKVHTIKIKTKEDITVYAHKVFELVNKTHSELHGFVAFEPERIRRTDRMPRFSLAGALRPARPHRPPRGYPAVRSPAPHRPTVRLSGPRSHAGRRTVHATLLPNGHRPVPVLSLIHI